MSRENTPSEPEDTNLVPDDVIVFLQGEYPDFFDAKNKVKKDINVESVPKEHQDLFEKLIRQTYEHQFDYIQKDPYQPMRSDKPPRKGGLHGGESAEADERNKIPPRKRGRNPFGQ